MDQANPYACLSGSYFHGFSYVYAVENPFSLSQFGKARCLFECHVLEVVYVVFVCGSSDYLCAGL